MKPVKYDQKALAATLQDKKRFWRHVTKSDGCWLYGRNPKKYGKFWIAGVNVQAHRFAKLLHSGRPRPSHLLALHDCKSKSCCRPGHIKWGTPKQNAQDRIRDKTNRPSSHLHEKHPGALLTVESTKELCKKYNDGGVSYASLGSQYGVTASCVARVVRRETWSAATAEIAAFAKPRSARGYVRKEKHHAARLNSQKVDEIRQLLERKVPQRKIAAMFSVSQGAISDIRHGRSWRV